MNEHVQFILMIFGGLYAGFILLVIGCLVILTLGYLIGSIFAKIKLLRGK